MSEKITEAVMQMRNLAYQGGLNVEPIHEAQRVDFSAALKHSLDQVNGLQQETNHLATSFELGDPDVDLADVMVAMQKSSLAFTGLTQVRNKLMEAYQDVIKMPV